MQCLTHERGKNMDKKIPFSPPDIGEEEIAEVVDTLKSGWITTGPKTKLLEKEIAKYCNTNKVVALNSATAALEMILRVLGIGEGDEVIVPSYTYTASCSVIYHVGATPVMVDIQENNFEMNYDILEKSITERTKAVIPVDIAGIICDYDKIFEVIERKKNIFKPNNKMQEIFNRVIVIADGAHSIGASRNGKMSGEIADFTAFSFHAVKSLTTAEGGAVTWKRNEKIDDEKIYNDFQILSLHGQTKDALAKMKLGAWEYDILIPAYKCNMTDINAAIGLAQLRRYSELLKKRFRIIEKYDSKLKGMNVKVLSHVTENSSSSAHLYITRVEGITIEQRNEIINKMAERGIATNVHYKPLPMLTAYKNKGFKMEDYPRSYEYYQNEITLPLYSLLTEEDSTYVIDNFVEILGEYI